MERKASRGFKKSATCGCSCSTAGRRGLAGGILFLKMVGGLAKSGKPLGAIVETCERDLLPNLGTIGVCLRPCIVPGNDSASFQLGDREMEVRGSDPGLFNMSMKLISKTHGQSVGGVAFMES